MNMRAISLVLLAFFVTAFAGKAVAENFAPKGEWVLPGFDGFSLTIKLEEGKLLYREGERLSERQVVIARQTERFLRLTPPAREGEKGVGASRGIDMVRLTDDAMSYGAGDIGGFLLVRKDAGLAFADSPPVTGRFGIQAEDGSYVVLVDLTNGVGGKKDKVAPLNMRESPMKGAIRMDLNREIVDARLLGDSILAFYTWSKHDKEYLPPFGLVAIP